MGKNSPGKKTKSPAASQHLRRRIALVFLHSSVPREFQTLLQRQEVLPRMTRIKDGQRESRRAGTDLPKSISLDQRRSVFLDFHFSFTWSSDGLSSETGSICPSASIRVIRGKEFSVQFALLVTPTLGIHHKTR
jgi:hypothetical protein